MLYQCLKVLKASVYEGYCGGACKGAILRYGCRSLGLIENTKGVLMVVQLRKKIMKGFIIL